MKQTIEVRLTVDVPDRWDNHADKAGFLQVVKDTLQSNIEYDYIDVEVVTIEASYK